VVLVARDITFANDFDGFPAWVGGPHGTDERVRYEADGCEDFVEVVLCNVLSQRPVDFLNSGCVPVCE